MEEEGGEGEEGSSRDFEMILVRHTCSIEIYTSCIVYTVVMHTIVICVRGHRDVCIIVDFMLQLFNSDLGEYISFVVTKKMHCVKW